MYTIEDYRQDVKVGYLLAPPQRGAAFAAASKRLKQAIVLAWLKEMAEAENVDLTPTLANHIAEGWMGRSVDRKELLTWFACQGRTASDKSPDHGRCEALVQQYRPAVTAALVSAQQEMMLVRAEEQARIFRVYGFTG